MAILPLWAQQRMNTNTARKRKSSGIDHTVDLSHPAGRRVRIRELCEIHDRITVGEIVQDMNRSVETDRGAVLGTLLDLDKAGFIMVLDAEDPMDREVALV
jgi:hypothetical protein